MDNKTLEKKINKFSDEFSAMITELIEEIESVEIERDDAMEELQTANSRIGELEDELREAKNDIDELESEHKNQS